MLHYVLGLVPPYPYAFRNGGRIQIERGIDHVPIIETFMRGDYGTVPDGVTVLDIGANIGTFSIYAAVTANRTTLCAYEPDSRYFDLLRRNVLLNGVEARVKCFNLAVAGKTGPRQLSVESADRFFPSLVDDDRASGPSTRVSCTTLAEIMTVNGLKQVGLLKMDCEGAEYEILFATPLEVLARIAEIRMEIHDFGVPGHDPARMKEFLRAHNFAVIRDQPMSARESSLWVRRHGAS